MPRGKLSSAEFVKLGPFARLLSLGWWGLVLVLTALAIAFFVVFDNANTMVDLLRGLGSTGGLIPQASADYVVVAASWQSGPGADMDPLVTQSFVTAGIFLVLGLLLLISFCVSLWSKVAERVETATKTYERLLAFFIGVGAGSI